MVALLFLLKDGVPCLILIHPVNLQTQHSLTPSVKAYLHFSTRRFGSSLELLFLLLLLLLTINAAALNGTDFEPVQIYL